ncbi:Spo0E family sporulation regulatory protein-aspartic acid phosphatase [Clostridium kluyveri]|uniref:Spo0E family sporulation regulatory protein-aspartic acid phosphatase n=1 Tax=Clostridium kluyveri TaxID=1534 RepID=UPI000AECEA54|nr:Spo0E family sporulation regulatory protein-aspartic acid phosphatase [Clostridium kluyveri]UZQ52324.1 Spo0E family sporulation regulatory protein-aspartic acid phosphatase [Clostridium kluyveri]
MKKQLEYKKDLNNKIEIIRELLYEKIEDNVDREEIQFVSEILDKLIVDYFK